MRVKTFYSSGSTNLARTRSTPMVIHRRSSQNQCFGSTELRYERAYLNAYGARLTSMSEKAGEVTINAFPCP